MSSSACMAWVKTSTRWSWSEAGFNHACRVYAPVGSHEDLLPYLVRRLLENGSNTSFVNRIADQRLPVEQVAEDPVDKARNTIPHAHPAIPLPADLSAIAGVIPAASTWPAKLKCRRLAELMQPFASHDWRAEPLLASTGQARGCE